MIARGLPAPALVITYGAPGIWKASRELWPNALEQRCTIHALRNVTSKLPERHHTEVKARWWKLFDEARSAGEARQQLQALAGEYRTAYPSAMAVVERDLDALVTHLRFPSEHRKRIRTTNLLERTFVEVRRRTKVLGRFPGETSALSLIWAVLELSSRGWRGVKMTPKAAAEIERLRRELHPHTPRRTREHQGGDRRITSHPKRSCARPISPGKRDATEQRAVGARVSRKTSSFSLAGPLTALRAGSRARAHNGRLPFPRNPRPSLPATPAQARASSARRQKASRHCFPEVRDIVGQRVLCWQLAAIQACGCCSGGGCGSALVNGRWRNLILAANLAASMRRARDRRPSNANQGARH
jgi:Transposase, Mutator family